jgi:hypothetical protein
MSWGVYLKSLLPRPLRDSRATELGRIVAVWGQAAEDLHAAMVAMRRLWFPATAPAVTLVAHGVGCRLPRRAPETAEAYRARLARAGEYWRLAGTAPGVKLAVDLLGLGAATVIEHWRELVRYDGSRAYDGTWQYGREGQWWEFSVRLPGPLDEAARAQVAAAVRAARNAHARLLAIVED